MTTGNIPSSWLALTGVWKVEELLPLLKLVEQRGVKENDLPAVKKLWDELQWKKR